MILNKFILSLFLISIFLPACNSVSQNPSLIIEKYLDALVKKDAAALVSMSCKTWESEAQKELDSFMNVGTSLEGIDCAIQSQSKTNASVVCKGFIKLTYDTEIQNIDLSKRVFQLSMENNEWRVCNSK